MDVRIGQVYEDTRKFAGCAISSEYARFRVVAVSRTKVTLARFADGVQQSVPRAKLVAGPWHLVEPAPEEIN